MSENTAIAAAALQMTQKELTGIKKEQIAAVLNLLQDGNTVPFIARYRKEATGSLDEVAIKAIEDTYQYATNLAQRKDEVIRLIAEQDLLTPELKKSIEAADKLQKVEDLYRPFKQKRQTKATIAKEKGLEPLAKWLLQPHSDVQAYAQQFISEEKELLTVEEVLQGAHEIIAEQIGDSAQYREYIRTYTFKTGILESDVKEIDKDVRHVYENYYEFSQAISQVKPHRILAINRGEKEGVLKVTIVVDDEHVHNYLYKQLHLQDQSESTQYVKQAAVDAYKRFIKPSIEREVRAQLTDVATEQAIHIFSDNLKNLLLQPPMKERIVLGLDPAYRTGCKLAIVDSTGRVLDKGVIYPHKPASESKRKEAAKIFQQFINKYNVEMVAIGNGTASRESEQFVAEQIKQLENTVHYVIVNEAGASVYSASEIAREEFPDFQVEERSAVSIARRLQDPLAELVKIDPKSVGVGQYQHDVSQKLLATELDFVVETVVNQVGVNVNTASASLLEKVAGINKTIANNIVDYRNEQGAFTKRDQLKKVPRLGPKAYEQAAGFLRIINGETVLDNTEIHPESYAQTTQLLDAYQIDLAQLETNDSKTAIQQIDIQEAIQLTGLGRQTLEDILDALQKPGRDIRDNVASPILRSDVVSMEDLKVGMQLEGTVRNVVDFGAFVDIGVKQDGLVHISKMSNQFIKSPSDVVSLGDIVTVWIDGIDLEKQRISLTMLPQ